MPAHHEPSPAVYGRAAVAEFAEFAQRAPLKAFGLAHRRVVEAAVLRASGAATALATGRSRACDLHARMHR